MATDAPRVVAQVVSSTLQSPPHIGKGRDLRTVLISEDANAIWNEIDSFIQSTKPLPIGDRETITQDLFLHLLSSQKFDEFLSEDCTEEEIQTELLLQLQIILQGNS
jgi:hypothetical protein